MLNSGKRGGPDRLLNYFFIHGVATLPKMFLKGYPWKQRLHQRTETRVCVFPGPD